MDFRQTLTCERIVLIWQISVRSHFRLLTRYARLYPHCATFFHGQPSVRFRNELYSGANTRVSQVVAVIENDTPKSTGNQRTWHTITGIGVRAEVKVSRNGSERRSGKRITAGTALRLKFQVR